MSLVNKHRLRPYTQDDVQVTIDSELVSLTEEVNRLSELEIELRGQKQYKQQQLEIATAQQEANQLNNVDNNNQNNEVNVVPEEINEDASDIQLNTYMITFQW